MNNFIEKDFKNYSKIRFLDIYMAGHKGFIAGGCFKNIFNNEKLKDVDVFFESEKDFDEAVKFYEDNIDEYVFSYENKNVKAFKNKKTNIRIELVRSYYGTPNEILAMFDFSITKFAYCKRTVVDFNNPVGGETIEYYVLLQDTFFEDLVNKKLVLEQDIKFPVSTFERSYRYTRYGYGLCRDSKRNLLEALKTADIDDLSQGLYFGID